MSPLLDVQRRMAEIGRVRIGMKNDRGLPTKLDRYRITSQSRDVVEAVATLYGGEVRAWQANPKAPKQWEVVTDANTLDIVVAPGQVLSQWWEKWRGGTCERRCDGQTEQLSDTPCMCPADLEQRREAATQKQPAACRPVTRFSFMIRDVPILGLFRLESRGEMVAMELSGVATFLELATQRGLFIPATLVLQERGVGTPHQYVVPVLQIHGSYQQIAEALGGMRTPVSLDPPTPMAALPSGSAVRQPGSSRAALPEAPKGRTRPVNYPAPPDLPSDPSFTIDPPIVAGSTAPLPGDTDQATKRSQQLHISARNSNCLDMLGELVEWATDGRTTSSKEVTDEEASKLHQAFSEIKRGKRAVSYDGAGKLVLS